MISQIKGDLFSVSSGVLAHACNVHGIWGGGIAAVFKRKFPQAYDQYHKHCQTHAPTELLGTCLVVREPNHPYEIACLFTNDSSSVPEVVNYTAQAIGHLISQIKPNTPINMPQINAGIFAIPWDETVKALHQYPDTQFNIYIL